MPSTPPSHASAHGSVRPGALAHPLPAGMRDLVPGEAQRLVALTRTVLSSFERFGYEVVSVPPFEYADVLEENADPLAAGEVLRFVEPETGEVVALRPDMTPQVARLVATRLGDAPLPARLCYEGAVVRRRMERARRDRQIHQAGFELVGLGGNSGDLEVLTVAASAVRASGLEHFTLDLGHAGVAGTLVSTVNPETRPQILEALAAKDESETVKRAERANMPKAELAALAALPALCGGADIWPRAEKLLSGTSAWAEASELRALYDVAIAKGLAPNVLVDLGETWHFAYYTGVMFQVLADGPGEAVGSGGRYDRLFDRFGVSRSAAGFAIDLGNLGWALERGGNSAREGSRLLVSGPAVSGDDRDVFLSELRRRGATCAEGPERDANAYALAWRYTHCVELRIGGVTVVDVRTGKARSFDAPTPRDAALATLGYVGVKSRESESV